MEKGERELISYFSLILLSILVFFFLVLPKYDQFLKLREENLTLQKKLELQKEYFEKIEEILSKIEEKKEQKSKIDNALPQGPKIPETLNFLQMAGAENGLLLKNVSFSLSKESEDQTEKKLKELKINLTLSGNYQSLKNFLKKIENSSRLIELENVSFSGKEPFEVKLSLKTFFLSKVGISPEIEKIDLKIFENPKLESLEPFPQIEPPKEEEIGNENPFSTLPFQTLKDKIPSTSTTSTLPSKWK